MRDDGGVVRGRTRGEAGGAGGLVCERDGTATTLRCAKCDRPICPKCLVQTPVGFTCDGHGGKPVYRADDLPLTPLDRPLRPPTPSPPLAPMVLFVAVPLVGLILRMASRGGSAGAGLFLVLPVVAFSVWFVVRRLRSP